MTPQGEKFILDYLSTYYFYEIDDFKRMREDGEKIIQRIDEYSRYQDGDVAFTKSRFGSIAESHTHKDVEVIISTTHDDVWIAGEKRHFDLQYKMETSTLEDHLRIATRLIADGQSISCMLYINYDQDKKFLAALERLKNCHQH